MRIVKKLALIAVGYGVAVAGGIAAAAINDLSIPNSIQQTSGGMAAFGDMVLFVLVTGLLSLVPTWFLLKLWLDKAPRTLVAAELLLAAIGPASWIAVVYLAAGPAPRDLPNAFAGVLGLIIAFGAIPRMVLGPVLLIVEGVTFLFIRERLARMLLSAAMLMDIIPLSMFALHIAAARIG